MTLKDIAKKAGVSTMTVSNVINGKHSHVSIETIEKINKLIKEYNYVPNMSARSLTSKTSHIIAILVSSNKKDTVDIFLENPYAGRIISFIEQALQKNGYYTMIYSITQKEDLTCLIKNWQVDGIIFLYPENKELLNEIYSAGCCPMAVFDSDIDHPDIINVCTDDYLGLYLSTEYLIKKGHTAIAFVGDYKGNPLLTRRLQGYYHALKNYNLPIKENYIFQFSPSYEGGIAAGKAIMTSSESITSAVTTSDLCAAGIIEGCRQNGFCVPKDLSIIGFDNSILCRYTFPQLTSVSQNMEKKAKTAVDLLLKKIKTGTLQESNFKKIPVKIIERSSVI